MTGQHLSIDEFSEALIGGAKHYWLREYADGLLAATQAISDGRADRDPDTWVNRSSLQRHLADHGLNATRR